MLLSLVSMGLLGAVAYKTMYSSPGNLLAHRSGVTGVLNENINNGFRFRDITYTDKIELAHPDVKNNSFYFQSALTHDRGNNGIPREYSQLYPGSSEITQLTVHEHLFL